MDYIQVTIGPREPGSGDGGEAEALRAALERAGRALEGAVRGVEVAPSLTAGFAVRARDGVHALEIAQELYREAYIEATNREVPPLDAEHA